MPRDRFVSDLPRVFVGSQAVQEGLLTARQLRGPFVRQVIRGIYAPANLRPSHELKCEAAGLLLAGRGAITGRSLATLRGVRLASADDDVEVAVLERRRFGPFSGLRVRRVAHEPIGHEPWRTALLATNARMGFDLAARRDLPVATAYLDAVASRTSFDLDAFRRWLRRCHDNDVCHVRRAADLADPRAESIPESRVRVILHLAGLVAEPQYVIRHHGKFVARVDLALVEQRVAIEYDGAWHALRQQLERDRHRLNGLREAGWDVVHVTAAMLSDPAQVVAAVRLAAARAR